MDLCPCLSTAVIGAFYSLGGLSLLTMRKWGAVLGILFISVEILGRVYLVMAGIAPSSGGDALKVVIGGAIALVVILYIMFTVEKIRVRRESYIFTSRIR